MKKVISIILSIIILISLLGLTIIININIIMKNKTISKVASNIKYIDLVNIKMKENELKETYDSIYISLQQEGISRENINKIYKQDFFEKITTKIIYTEVKFLLTGNISKTYTINDINNLIKKDIEKINLQQEEKEKIIKILNYNSSKILTIENIIRSNINNISPTKIKIVRYFLSYKFKVILLCLLIICILIELVLNKERLLPYIFIPTIICSFLELLISIFTPKSITTNIANKFLESILYPYIKIFLNNLLFTSLIILGISIIYLMVNESVMKKEKRRLKPKIKKKRRDI